jgi:hypothetical protein
MRKAGFSPGNARTRVMPIGRLWFSRNDREITSKDISRCKYVSPATDLSKRIPKAIRAADAKGARVRQLRETVRHPNQVEQIRKQHSIHERHEHRDPLPASTIRKSTDDNWGHAKASAERQFRWRPPGVNH